MDTKKLRQKVLDLAIRGKLVPQDPNDEPASVLLERIRAEKERLIKEGKIKRSKNTASDTNENEIPNGWVCCRFDEICSQFSTGPFGSMVHKSDYVSQNGTPIVNPMNIIGGKIVTNNLMMVSNEKAQELDRYRLTKDDILIARRGDLRKCCIVTEESIDWLCGTGSFFLHAPFVEPRYIEIFYLSEYVQMTLKRECVGATMDNLNQSVLGSIPFLLPPLSEQRRIVNEIERWFTVIDVLESNEGDLLKAIGQAKSKILDLAIHGKLVPQDPNDEPAIELLKRINPKFEPCDNALYEDIPCGWEVCTINDIASSELGKTLDKEKNKGEYKPYLCSINVFWNQFNLTEMKQMRFEESELDHYSIQQGDLVICEGGDAGRCAVWPNPYTVLFQNAIHRVRFKEDIVPYFFMYVIMYLKNKHILDNYCKGVTIKHFTKTALLSLPVPLPPIKEQLRIVEKIEEPFAVLDDIKNNI